MSDKSENLVKKGRLSECQEVLSMNYFVIEVKKEETDVVEITADDIVDCSEFVSSCEESSNIQCPEISNSEQPLLLETNPKKSLDISTKIESHNIQIQPQKTNLNLDSEKIIRNEKHSEIYSNTETGTKLRDFNDSLINKTPKSNNSTLKKLLSQPSKYGKTYSKSSSVRTPTKSPKKPKLPPLLPIYSSKNIQRVSTDSDFESDFEERLPSKLAAVDQRYLMNKFLDSQEEMARTLKYNRETNKIDDVVIISDSEDEGPPVGNNVVSDIKTDKSNNINKVADQSDGGLNNSQSTIVNLDEAIAKKLDVVVKYDVEKHQIVIENYSDFNICMPKALVNSISTETELPSVLPQPTDNFVLPTSETDYTNLNSKRRILPKLHTKELLAKAIHTRQTKDIEKRPLDLSKKSPDLVKRSPKELKNVVAAKLNFTVEENLELVESNSYLEENRKNVTESRYFEVVDSTNTVEKSSSDQNQRAISTISDLSSDMETRVDLNRFVINNNENLKNENKTTTKIDISSSCKAKGNPPKVATPKASSTMKNNNQNKDDSDSDHLMISEEPEEGPTTKSLRTSNSKKRSSSLYSPPVHSIDSPTTPSKAKKRNKPDLSPTSFSCTFKDCSFDIEVKGNKLKPLTQQLMWIHFKEVHSYTPKNEETEVICCADEKCPEKFDCEKKHIVHWFEYHKYGSGISCVICSYKATTTVRLQQHFTLHGEYIPETKFVRCALCRHIMANSAYKHLLYHHKKMERERRQQLRQNEEVNESEECGMEVFDLTSEQVVERDKILEQLEKTETPKIPKKVDEEVLIIKDTENEVVEQPKKAKEGVVFNEAVLKKFKKIINTNLIKEINPTQEKISEELQLKKDKLEKQPKALIFNQSVLKKNRKITKTNLIKRKSTQDFDENTQKKWKICLNSAPRKKIIHREQKQKDDKNGKDGTRFLGHFKQKSAKDTSKNDSVNKRIFLKRNSTEDFSAEFHAKRRLTTPSNAVKELKITSFVADVRKHKPELSIIAVTNPKI